MREVIWWVVVGGVGVVDVVIDGIGPHSADRIRGGVRGGRTLHWRPH